jgi:hypothetical protein
MIDILLGAEITRLWSMHILSNTQSVESTVKGFLLLESSFKLEMMYVSIVSASLLLQIGIE